MEIKILFSLLMASATLFSCAITHVRGNDPQVAIDFYKTQKKSIEPKIKEILKENRTEAGTITLDWKINDQGDVMEAYVKEDSIGDPELSETILNHLKSLRFPKTPMFMTSEVEYSYKISK
jgi:hypothetical protein